MAERGAGVLSRIHFGHQTVLHRGEIVHITTGAAGSLAAFLDRRFATGRLPAREFRR